MRLRSAPGSLLCPNGRADRNARRRIAIALRASESKMVDGAATPRGISGDPRGRRTRRHGGIIYGMMRT